MSEMCDILIVDDQPGVRKLLEELLAAEGYRVVTAASGAAALELMSRLEPRLIILDMKMPGLDGAGTLKELRKMGVNVPVMMMTAYGELEIREETESYGVRQYIVKPFDLDEIRLSVREALGDAAGEESFEKIGRK